MPPRSISRARARDFHRNHQERLALISCPTGPTERGVSDEPITPEDSSFTAPLGRTGTAARIIGVSRRPISLTGGGKSPAAP
jgi:hypothetical protein